MNQNHQNRLTPEKLQMFAAGLSGMDPEEIRKAKLLFIRNEISQLRAMKTSMQSFGVIQGCFAIIPFFWPILWAQRSMIKAGLRLQGDQIGNALSVWAEDLGADAAELKAELASLLA
jgi:hypothetical protein